MRSSSSLLARNRNFFPDLEVYFARSGPDTPRLLQLAVPGRVLLHTGAFPFLREAQCLCP